MYLWDVSLFVIEMVYPLERQLGMHWTSVHPCMHLQPGGCFEHGLLQGLGLWAHAKNIGLTWDL